MQTDTLIVEWAVNAMNAQKYFLILEIIYIGLQLYNEMLGITIV